MITDQYRLRSSIIFVAISALYAIIIFNLYLIQIRDADFFTQLGQQQYHVTIQQPQTRAPIVDRTGTHYLAVNNDCISAFILPNKLKQPEKTTEFLKKHFPHAHTQLLSDAHKQFMYIKRKLSPEQIAVIKESEIADIKLLHESNRFYPIACTSPIVGITDIDNKGIIAAELIYDKQLAGIPTTLHLHKDARSGYFHFKKETKDQGTVGTPVQLTIDGTLQFLVEQELKETVEKFQALEGAAIIMNPANGEIISMVSYPYFNPNDTNTIDLTLTKNKVVTEAYELGSVIKIFAALAALEQKVVTPEECIDCKNTKTTYIEGRKINTWKENGLIPFADVIAQSNNIGTAIVAKRVDTALYDHYKKIGFGRKTGIDFPGENPGFVNPPENWSKQSIISLSYGYEVSATLLQLACGFCMIANNGYAVTPTLTLQKQAPLKKNKIYSDASIEVIQNILKATSERGTTRSTAINGYTIMSKTGTANRLIDGQYDTTKQIYTCAGIVQKDDYQRVIVTFIKESNRQNVYAATVAAPLFKKIAQKMLIHDRRV